MTDDAAYWIALSTVPGVGPALFRGLCDRFGEPADVFRASREDLEGVRGIRATAVTALLRPGARIRAAENIVNELAADGYDVLTFRDHGYPAGLRDLRDPPPVLYSLGRLRGRRTFSVAGSTAPSARGAGIARRAAKELARAGWVVTSGYAPGIDSAAHLAALEARRRTVLVLPFGVRAFRLRPEFRRFEDQLGRRMVLLSERPPDEGWSSRNAVCRDRIIAALGRALLVVEARPDSGTMITFRHAMKLGRPAYVIHYRRAPAGAAGNRLAVRAGGLPVASMRALRHIARASSLPRAMPATVQGELF